MQIPTFLVLLIANDFRKCGSAILLPNKLPKKCGAIFVNLRNGNSRPHIYDHRIAPMSAFPLSCLLNLSLGAGTTLLQVYLNLTRVVRELMIAFEE